MSEILPIENADRNGKDLTIKGLLKSTQDAQPHHDKTATSRFIYFRIIVHSYDIRIIC